MYGQTSTPNHSLGSGTRVDGLATDADTAIDAACQMNYFSNQGQQISDTDASSNLVVLRRCLLDYLLSLPFIDAVTPLIIDYLASQSVHLYVLHLSAPPNSESGGVLGG